MNLLRRLFPRAASMKSCSKTCTYCSCSSLVELDGTYYCPGCSTYLSFRNGRTLEQVGIPASNSAVITEKSGNTTEYSDESSCLCAMCKESEHRAYMDRRRREREREVAGLEIDPVQKISVKIRLRTQTSPNKSLFAIGPKRQMMDDVKYCSSCVERINRKLLNDAEKNYPEYARHLQRVRVRSISFVVAGALSYFLLSSGMSFYLHLLLLFVSKNGWFLIPLLLLLFPSDSDRIFPFRPFIYPSWTLLVTGSTLISTRKKTVRFIDTHGDLGGISEHVLRDLSLVRISGDPATSTGDVHTGKAKAKPLMQKKTQIRIKEEAESKEISRICDLLSRLTIQQGMWSKSVSRIKEWALAKTPSCPGNG